MGCILFYVQRLLVDARGVCDINIIKCINHFGLEITRELTLYFFIYLFVQYTDVSPITNLDFVSFLGEISNVINYN